MGLVLFDKLTGKLVPLKGDEETVRILTTYTSWGFHVIGPISSHLLTIMIFIDTMVKRVNYAL